MPLEIPARIQVLVLLFVLVGIIGWSFWKNLVTGKGPQPTWQSPEYLRYNRATPDTTSNFTTGGMSPSF